MPCELIDNNGNRLHEYCIRLAKDWQLEPSFSKWIKNNVKFMNTLVDRIVPGFPKEEIKAIDANLGYEDQLITVTEQYYEWIIEGSPDNEKELPFKQADLNVHWTKNLKPYRERKVRILNASHTIMAIAGFLYGKNTVYDCMEDNLFADLLKRAIYEEILPALTSHDHEELNSYTNSILDRFLNPLIRHELTAISLNSVSKFRERILPGILDYFKFKNDSPPVLSFTFAVLIYYYKIEYIQEDAMFGKRNMQRYRIKDIPEVLHFFNEQWNNYRKNGNSFRLCKNILKNQNLWQHDLTEYKELLDSASCFLNDILEAGIKNTLYKLLDS